MRTRADVEHEMQDVVADIRAAAAEHDEISVDLDHARLNDLIWEWETIPRPRHAAD